jgi:hypothetical protein
MRDLPSGDELAALARALGATDARAARCQAIAERERAAGEGAFAAVRAALATRYGAAEDRALLARLAAEIRDGLLDEGSADRSALAAVLRALTRQKLAENNPAYLERD